MPRTASFDLSEVKISSQKVPQPQYRGNFNSHVNSKSVSQESPPKKEKCCHCSCGWSVALFMSACSFTFLVLVSLFPEYFVSQFLKLEKMEHERQLLVKKGYLRVYPNISNMESEHWLRGTYSIDPSSEYVAKEIVPSIEEVLKNYTEFRGSTYPPNPYILCWLENPLEGGTPCYFDKNWILKDCNKENDYGYRPHKGLYSPCILLRVEETEDWVPKLFKLRDVNEVWLDRYDASYFAVSCYPLNNRYRREIKVRTHPSKGFPIHFFPQKFFREELYLPPMVMVQFMDLEVGEDFSVECWINTRNSYFLKNNGIVKIHFHSKINENMIPKDVSYLEESIDSNLTKVKSRGEVRDDSTS